MDSLIFKEVRWVCEISQIKKTERVCEPTITLWGK